MDVISKFRLDGKVAVVTGGGKGIGKAIALHYAQVGAHVVVAEFDPATGKATSEEIRRLGGKSVPVVVDVTRSDQLANLVEVALKEFKRIDILVNNVGGSNPMTPAVNISDEVWEKCVRLNLTSTFLTTKAVSRVMIDQNKGNIVNISSSAGTRADPGVSPYAAAKAGVINFTQTMSIELAPFHIRVNCIIPSTIETGVSASVRGATTAQERVAKQGIPLGRLGQPEDIALSAIFLASDASDYITGTCLEVKGGPYTRKGDAETFFAKYPKF